MDRFRVKKHTLLLLAAVVWMVAGFWILRIGTIFYGDYKGRILIFLSFGVFLIFWIGAFARIVRKQTARICSYGEEMQSFYRFFDRKSLLILVCILLLGSAVCKLQLWSVRNIAVFYTGLGAAMFCAGGAFLGQYIVQRKRQKWKEEEQKKLEKRKANLENTKKEH